MNRLRSSLPLAVLTVSQIVGWGTTYYLPSSIAEAFERDLGLGRTTLYLGVTVMLIVAGLASPTAGRLFDRHGAARFLPMATALIALGLCGLLLRPGPVGWLAVWGLFGLAQAFGLSVAAQTYLTRIDPAEARRNIGLLLIGGGLASTIFWPITALLEARFGWWTTVLVYALLQICVVLPGNLWLALRRSDRIAANLPGEGTGARALDFAEPVPKPRRAAAEAVMTFAFAVQGFAAWGLPLHIIELFQDLGLDKAAAVGVAAASGPATILARAIEIGWGRRWRPLDLTLAALLVLLPSAAVALAPVPAMAAAIALTLGWNGANGILTLLRVTVPLSLFGPQGFGALSGRIALPTNLVFASAPAAFAVLIGDGGPVGGVATAVVCAAVAIAATMVLIRIVREGTAPSAGAAE